MGWGGGGEDGGPLDGATRAVAVVGGLDGCLDPAATRPYGGSRATREEKAAKTGTSKKSNKKIKGLADLVHKKLSDVG
jgi:hypothetical protein